MFVYIVVGAIVCLMLYAFYMGMFTKLEVKEGEFPGGFYVYYDYQGHINNATLFHQNLQKSLEGVDTSNLIQMTIAYDDPFNLRDPRSYRASLGFLLPHYDSNLVEKFKKLHYQWTSVPQCEALCGNFPYRNAASLSFASTRFLPACLTYILRNRKTMKKALEK